MNTTGDRIAARMQELGLKQGDVSRMMKEVGFSAWHQTTVTRTISGERALKLDEGFGIADILGVAASYLVGRDDSTPTQSGTAPAKAALDRAIHQLTEIREGL